MTALHKCCAKTGNGYFGSPCIKSAKYERDGKWYCGTHDPVAIKAKRDARNSEWKREFDAKNKARDVEIARLNEAKRRADCYPDLLDALMAAKRHLSVSSDEWAMADAAIAKAAGSAP